MCCVSSEGRKSCNYNIFLGFQVYRALFDHSADLLLDALRDWQQHHWFAVPLYRPHSSSTALYLPSMDRILPQAYKGRSNSISVLLSRADLCRCRFTDPIRVLALLLLQHQEAALLRAGRSCASVLWYAQSSLREYSALLRGQFPVLGHLHLVQHC